VNSLPALIGFFKMGYLCFWKSDMQIYFIHAVYNDDMMIIPSPQTEKEGGEKSNK
jgi:hypothetical protein